MSRKIKEFKFKGEVKSVCKCEGRIFFAFISNDMIITTETRCYDLEFLGTSNYLLFIAEQ
jgi:hypothetical protein